VLESLQSVEREVESDHGRWYIAKVLPYRTDNDSIDGTVLTFTDITARKQAEEAVRAREEQFRRAIEDAPIPVIMHAEDGEILQLSRSWTKHTGYTAKDLPTIEAWFSTAYAFGADAVRAHMHELFSGRRPVLDVELAIRTRAGEQRYWSFSASSPGTLRDGRRFVIGMAVDITERKRASEALVRSEERLRLMIESVADYAIFTTDAAGLIDSWNLGAQRLFGFTEAEALGQSCAIIFTPEDRVKSAHEEEMRIARERGAAPDERWHVRKGGGRFFASGTLTCMRNGEQVLGYTKVAQDLTTKRETDEALRLARDELEARVATRTGELAQSNEALRSEVARGAESQELRIRLLRHLVDAQEQERKRLSRELHDQLGQQLTALTLKLATLKSMEGLDPAVRGELDGLEAIAKQVDSDIDYLAWELRPTALDDLGLVEALNDYARTWSKHFGLPAKLHANGFDGERLSGLVETVLYRIAQEALNNVAKHAGASGVELILDKRADHVSLIVEDDGIGFDADQTVTNPSSLGLVGMRERAAFAGGTLEIESGPGKGASVFVRIPTST
jgi:PAS domain S-box-containing protein